MSDQDLPSLDLKQLNYFLEVARSGSISGTASALGIAQATLSENVAKLEQRLGVTLAVRGSRGITLTEAGERLARQGPALIEHAKTLVADLTRTHETSAAIAVGLPPSLSRLIGVPLAETLRAEQPAARFQFVEGMSDSIAGWIQDETIDLGVVYERPDHRFFDHDAFYCEDLFLIAASDFLPTGTEGGVNPRIGGATLAELPLVLPTRKQATRRFIDRTASRRRLRFNQVTEIDSYAQLLEMVGRASAYALLPKMAVLSELKAGTIVAIGLKDITFRRTCFLTRKRDRVIRTASMAVHRTALEIIREMSERYDLGIELLDHARPAES